MQNAQVKLCQSCIERQYNPPQMATREYAPGIYYCDECFTAIVNNMMNIAPASLISSLPELPAGPFLNNVYSLLKIPIELQFGNIQTTCRNQDKLFNHHAIAIVNLSEEDTAKEIEQLGCSLFQIQYKIDALKNKADKMKEERRREKGLTSYDDSKEEYSKPKAKAKSKVKQGEEDKLANTLAALSGGKFSPDQLAALKSNMQEEEKKKRERQFNILAGNCPECGGAMPCKLHPEGK